MAGWQGLPRLWLQTLNRDSWPRHGQAPRASQAGKLKTASMEYDEHLPKLISYAMVTDRLTRTETGDWRVCHKRVEKCAEDKAFHF
jgi:hypothetical protein